MAIEFLEKRLTPRVNLRAPLRYQLRGSQEFAHVLCDDISAGGLSFTCSNFIPTNTPLMLEINLFSRILRPVAQVAWSSPVPHSDKKKLGLKFLELQPMEKNYINSYVNIQTSRLSGNPVTMKG
jgi:hypothetical protein